MIKTKKKTTKPRSYPVNIHFKDGKVKVQAFEGINLQQATTRAIEEYGAKLIAKITFGDHKGD